MTNLNQKITVLHNCEYHQENKSIFRRNQVADFEEVIRASQRQGFTYVPEIFNQQLKWLRCNYYKTSGNGSKVLFFRVFSGNDPDHQTTKQEVHSTLQNRFGEELHPVLNEFAVYLLPTTIGQRYDPSTSDAFIECEYSWFRNTYKPPLLQPTAKVSVRPKIWQEYLDRIMPPENLCVLDDNTRAKEQDYFEAWLSQRIQDPSGTNTVVLVLRGEHGTGKGFVGDVLMKELVGKKNYAAVSLEDLTGKYIQRLYSKTLIQVEEAIQSNRNTITEKLKATATQEDRWGEEKWKVGDDNRKYFGLYLTSNEEYPVRVENNDRRFFIPCFSKHRTNAIESHQFFKNVFCKWLDEEGGYQIMLNYLHALDISRFNFHRPPMTDSKQMLMEDETNAVQAMHRVSIILQDFPNCVFFLESVVKKWKLNTYAAKSALTSAGFKSVRTRRIKLDGDDTNKSHRVWVHKSVDMNDPELKRHIYLFDPDRGEGGTVFLRGKEY